MGQVYTLNFPPAAVTWDSQPAVNRQTETTENTTSSALLVFLK